MKIRVGNILIVAISLFTVIYDYFVTRDLWLESTYFMAICLLLLLSLIRFSHIIKMVPLWLNVIFNLVIVTSATVNFYYLVLFLWGYGFQGTTIPFIWYFAVISNVANVVMAIYSHSHFSRDRLRTSG
ncbi:MAG TPA: hypothetical protein VF581_05850 [Flavobacterium sp.]|jgi:hypothetical protein